MAGRIAKKAVKSKVAPKKTVAKKTAVKKTTSPAQLQKPKSVADMLKLATTLPELETIVQNNSLDDDDYSLLDKRITAVLEDQETELNKKIQPFIDKFEAAANGARKLKKQKTLKMDINIPVTLTLDVDSCDVDGVIDQITEGWDDVVYEDLQWDADAQIGKLKLSKKQLELLNSIDILSDIKCAISDGVQNACEQIFDFFPESQDFLKKLDSFKNELLTQRENIQMALDDFQEVVDNAGSVSVNGDFYEPYLSLHDFL